MKNLRASSTKLRHLYLQHRQTILLLLFVLLPLNAKPSNDTLQLIKTNLKKGNQCYRQADFYCASRQYFEALRLSEQLNDSLFIAIACQSIATIYHETNHLDKAAGYAQRAISILEKLDQPQRLGDAYNTLANVYYNDYRDSLALIHYQKAIQQWKIARDSAGLFAGYKNLGAVLTEMGFPEQGLAQMEESIRYLQQQDDSTIRFSAYMTLGEACVYNKLLEKGKMYLDTAARFLPFINAIHKLDDYHYALYFYYKQKRDFENALQQHELFKQYADSVNSIEKFKQLSELNTRYETGKKELQIRNQQAMILEEQSTRRLAVATAAFIIFLLLALFIIFRQYQQRKTEKLLQEQNAKNLQEIFQAEQNERIRLARDLHDSLGQKLSVIRMLLSQQPQSGEWQQITHYIDQTAAEVRSISHNLIPEILHLGFVKAIESLADQFNSTQQLKVHFSADESLRVYTLDKQTELSLYRILQEILANIVKHSGANAIIIAMKITGNTMQIYIEDQGKGFDPRKAEVSDGLGWKNIFARIRLINGNIKIHSEKNKGSKFMINIPVA